MLTLPAGPLPQQALEDVLLPMYTKMGLPQEDAMALLTIPRAAAASADSVQV